VARSMRPVSLCATRPRLTCGQIQTDPTAGRAYRALTRASVPECHPSAGGC
jgi:hypothetical protein